MALSGYTGPSVNPMRRNIFVYLAIVVAGMFAVCLLLYRPTFPTHVFSPPKEFAAEPADEAADEPVDEPKQFDLNVAQPASSSRLHWDFKTYNDVNFGDFGLQPNQSYHSTNILSPLFQVNTWKPRAAEGAPYLFMAPAIKAQGASVQIYSRKDLSLVYANVNVRAAGNARVQMYNGKQYFTFWEGLPASGHGQGNGLMYDQHYNLAYNLSINTLDTMADSHEFQLTEDGGALLTAYETVRNWDMTPVGGPQDGVLQDSCFEEIDIATGETRFTWRASDWFNITETTVGYNNVEDYGHPTNGAGWDFFHINSLEKTKEGNYLVVGRRLNLVTLINGTTGAPIWQVGGKNNQFRDLSGGRATNFGYQHHVRFDNDKQNEIVMFDNSDLAGSQPNPGCQERCSRGLHLRLDFEAMTVEAVKEYHHPHSVQSRAEGGVERQKNGNLLVGWGKVPGFTEYSREGEVLMDVQTGPWRTSVSGNAHVYRIYSMDWTAYPPWNPDVAVFEGDVYASWNGATELANWALLAGDAPESLTVQYVVYRGGFETKLPLRSPALFARAAALDADGNLLGSTDVVNMQTGEHIPMADSVSVAGPIDRA